jgi:hypothetical protein
MLGMAKIPQNHPWRRQYSFKPRDDPETAEMKILAEFLFMVPRIDGNEEHGRSRIFPNLDEEEGYCSWNGISQYAQKHSRDFDAIEQGVERMITKGYAEIKDGRFIRLTESGLGLIDINYGAKSSVQL